MSKDTDRATPRPWVVEHDGESDERTYFPVITFEARNIAVVEAYYGDGAANAALIVRAVNAHDALVEDLEYIVDAACLEPDELAKLAEDDIIEILVTKGALVDIIQHLALALGDEVQP